MKSDRRTFLLGTSAALGLAAFPSIVRAAPKKLIMQTGSPSPNSGFATIFLAQKLGYFTEENLEVEIRYTRGANIAMQLVSTGQADIGFFVYDSLIVGYGEGLRGTYFYQYYTQPIFMIGVPGDSPIKQAADLKGMKIGVASLGSAGVPIAKSILRAANADPASVTFVPVGVGNQALVALRNKTVDAVSLWDAPLGSLEVLGANLRYIEHPRLKNIGSGGYVASPSVFAGRQADLVGFGRAMAKASLFTLTNPEAAIRNYWEVNPAGKPTGSDAEAMKIMLTEMKLILRNIQPPVEAGKTAPWGDIKLASLQQYIDVNAQELDLKMPPKAEQIANPKLVEAINKFDVEAIKKKAAAAK